MYRSALILRRQLRPLHRTVMRSSSTAVAENRTGRGFSDPWDLTDMLNSKIEVDDLPDWDPKYVSQVAKDKVKVLQILTLEEMINLQLPSSLPPSPSQKASLYALHRQRDQAQYIAKQVRSKVIAHVETLAKKRDSKQQQEAVDELFESIEFELKEKEKVLGKHPKFGKWVEQAIEQTLQEFNKGSLSEAVEEEVTLPVFMDCFQGDDGVCPSILSPLQPLPRSDNQGRMMEEWQLAANKKTKRILIRSSTQSAARAIHENKNASVVVTGRRGVGKTAVLSSIVASARASGYIVLYIPDGQRYHEFGFYIEPSPTRQGVFDLPVLSQDVCKNLLQTHKANLSQIKVDSNALKEHFTKDEVKSLDGVQTLSDLIELGSQKLPIAAACYSATVRQLIDQTEHPFLIVSDEYNCFLQTSKCFHMDYDPEVRQPIPYEKISLFEPLFESWNLTSEDKQSRILVGMTESRGVARSVTGKFIEEANASPHKTVVDVSRLSDIESECLIANYESIGLGKLRLDQGKILTNENEIRYLRTVSGRNPQELMNACIL